MKWYALAIVLLTIAAFFSGGAKDTAFLLYAIPGNLLLYFVPVWVVVRIIRWSRARKPKPKPPLPQEDDPAYDVLPDMKRK